MKDGYEISRLKREWLFIELVKGGRKISYDNLSEARVNLSQYEKPDMITKVGDYLIGIEHFEFDKSKTTKKGSADRIKTSESVKSLLRKAKSLPAGERVINTYSLGAGREEWCVSNIKKAFDNHYCKIDSYVKNLAKDFDYDEKYIKMWFFMENMIAMADRYENDDGETVLIAPIFYDGVSDIIKDKPKLDGILMNHGEYLFIIPNDNLTMSAIKEESQRIKRFHTHQSNPRIIDFAVKNQ